jgi:hypothetical protein
MFSVDTVRTRDPDQIGRQPVLGFKGWLDVFDAGKVNDGEIHGDVLGTAEPRE